MMYTNLTYTEQIDLKVKVFLVTDMKRKSINDNLITLKAVKRRCFSYTFVLFHGMQQTDH